MKILTNWSTAGRTAMATLMLASSALGVTSCINRSNNSGSNSLIEDVFVKEKPADIVYKTNETQIHRYIGHIPKEDEDYKRFYNEYKQIFDERGLYGGTLYIQRKEDLERISGFPGNLVDYKEDLYNLTRYDYEEYENSSDPEEQDFYRTFMAYRDWMTYFHGISMTSTQRIPDCFYRNFIQKLDDDLFVDENPTWQQCSNYIDRQVAGLDFLSEDDYAKYKENVKNFEKAQKNNTEDDIANLLAYKQYQLDSIVLRKIYKDLGMLKTVGDRKYYKDFWQEEYITRRIPKPNTK